MLVQEFLQDNAARRPEKVALISRGQRWTYGCLDSMADRLANALREFGVNRGDRIVVHLGNSVEAVVAMFAALKADAAFVAVNRITRPEKFRLILRHCDAAAVITDARGAQRVLSCDHPGGAPSLRAVIVCDAGSNNRQPGSFHEFAEIQNQYPSHRACAQNIDLDLACLIYTSGTTGEPKGVMCDHARVVFATRSIAAYLKNTSDDVVLNVLPMASSYGLYQLMAMFCVGGTLVLEESFAFPAAVLATMARERVTGFAGVPTIYSLMLGMDLRSQDLSSLRYVTNAADGLPIEHVKRLRQTLPRVELYLMHGLTEVARTMYLPPGQVDARPGSSGIPLPGTELWIENEAGKRLGPGEVGELVVRGRNVMRGYWNDPVKTEERFRPGPLPGERVCHSGDLFQTDEQGYFYFVGRKDEIIKSRGEKVAPREVEDVLCALPGVQDAAVIGVPDPLLGQAIKAFIVAPGGGLTEAAVIAHCKSRLEEYMVPQFVEFRPELPKTGNGKIRKLDLL
jgi:long-chain acyl-CoA synthetase